MKQKQYIVDLPAMKTVAQELASYVGSCAVFTFEGPLGAGKTTLIQELLALQGIALPVVSPTFTYVNVYENAQGQLFYHFDLYRMNSLEEFLQAGFDEFLYVKNSWAFIEWPAIVMPLLAKHGCNVTIDYADHQRAITVTTV